MKEWTEVYQSIFSKDLVKVENGFEKLRCWKGRCHRLPAGIECTLVILEAVLIELKVDHEVLSTYSIMKSVYALALTRFLNHVTSFEKDKIASASLYKIARHLNIPEWIVSLRHEAAHGSELPSLEVLQSGVMLALDWLHTKYWMKGLPLVNVSSINEGKRIEFGKRVFVLVDVYQKLHCQMFDDVMFIKHITDSRLMETMEDILNTSDEFWLFSESSDNIVPVRESMPLFILQFVNITVRKLKLVFTAAKKEAIDLDFVVDKFFKYSYFVPTQENIHIFKPVSGGMNPKRITTYMAKMWETILSDVIDEAGVLPLFMKGLIDFRCGNDFRQIWAAVWVKEISLAIKKAHLIKCTVLPDKNEKYDNFLIVEREEMEKELHRKYPNLRTLTLSWDNFKDLTAFKPLIEDVLFNPRRTSLVYVKQLLGIYCNPLTVRKKMILIKAMNLFLKPYEPGESPKDAAGSSTHSYSLKDVHTLISKKAAAVEPMELSEQEPCQDNWEGAPIGMLPWQEGIEIMAMDDDYEEFNVWYTSSSSSSSDEE